MQSAIILDETETKKEREIANIPLNNTVRGNFPKHLILERKKNSLFEERVKIGRGKKYTTIPGRINEESNITAKWKIHPSNEEGEKK